MSEAPLTLSDILNKTPEDIIKQITVRQEVAQVPDTELSKKEIEDIKSNLKAFFMAEPDKLRKGQTLRVNSKYFLDIVDVTKSTNRVFFKPRFPPNSKTFSLAISYLVGTDFPYKVGDEIVYGLDTTPIVSVSPSTSTVVIQVENQKVRLKVKDVVKCQSLQ